MTTILITSVGQRGYLVDYFKESVAADGQVFAADATRFAPAFMKADRCFVIPRADDPAFDDALVDICDRQDIDAVVSINDLELPALARLRERLADVGTVAVVSSPEVIATCFDKYLTYEFLGSHGFDVPLTLTDEQFVAGGAGGLPAGVIAKPRRGSRSQGLTVFPTAAEAIEDARDSVRSGIPVEQRRVYQEFIDSPQYSLHVFNDLSGRPIRVVGMVNLVAHMSGETFHLMSVADPGLLEVGWRLGNALGHVGPLSVDVHVKDGKWVVLELNPRFGGGYPVTHFAGGDFTGLLLDMVAGKTLTADEGLGFEPGVVALKQYTAAGTTLAEIESRVEP